MLMKPKAVLYIKIVAVLWAFNFFCNEEEQISKERMLLDQALEDLGEVPVTSRDVLLESVPRRGERC
jgi:hypothetical protein